MTITHTRLNQRTLHPLHGVLLAATVPLFLGGLLSDLAYAASYQIQWSNFASWLIAGGLVFGGLALLCALLGALFSRPNSGHYGFYIALLAVTWILGFLNSLIHAKDAWAIMPTAPLLSVVVWLLACASTWIGFVSFGVGSLSLRNSDVGNLAPGNITPGNIAPGNIASGNIASGNIAPENIVPGNSAPENTDAGGRR